MDINIELDAGGVTGGADDALATLRKIRDLVARMEPVTARLSKDSRVDFSPILASLKGLVSESSETARKLQDSMRQGALGAAQALRGDLIRSIQQVQEEFGKLKQVSLSGSGAGRTRGLIGQLQQDLRGLTAQVPAAVLGIHDVTQALTGQTAAATSAATAEGARTAAVVSAAKAMASGALMERSAALVAEAAAAERAAAAEGARVASLIKGSSPNLHLMIRERTKELLSSAAAAEASAKAEMSRVRALEAASAAVQRRLTANLLAERSAEEAFRQRQFSAALAGRYVHPNMASESATAAASASVRTATVDAALQGRAFSVLGSRESTQAQAALASAVKSTSSAMADGADKAGALTAAMGSNQRMANDLHSAYRGLASGFGAMWLTWGNVLPLLAGAGISHAATNAVKAGMAFEKVMTDTQALSDISTESMNRLTKSVLDLGGATQYGPIEMAEGIKVLTLAGLDAESAMKALPQVMDFAKVSEMPMKAAAEQLVAVTTAFGYSIDSMSYVSDIIAKTAASSMAAVDEMGQSFRTASTAATQYRVSLADTATGLGLLAQIGIKGQMAGTSFRQMYAELAGGSRQAQAALKQLNIEVFNSDGSAKSLRDVVTQVARGMDGMSAAAQNQLLHIITNERGMRQMGAVLQQIRDEAAKAGTGMSSFLQKLEDDISHAAGYSALKAIEMGDSTEQAFKRAGSTLETTFIGAFKDAQPAVQALATSLRDLFKDETFKSGLATLINGLASLASMAVKNVGTITALAGAFMAAKLSKAAYLGVADKVVRTMSAVGEFAIGATNGVTMLGGALTTLKGIAGPVAIALSAVAAAYMAWRLLTSNQVRDEALAAAKTVDDARQRMRESAQDYDTRTAALWKGQSEDQASSLARSDKMLQDALAKKDAEIKQQREYVAAIKQAGSVGPYGDEGELIGGNARLKKLLDERTEMERGYYLDRARMVGEAEQHAVATEAAMRRKQEETAKLYGSRTVKDVLGGGDKKGKNEVADELRDLEKVSIALEAARDRYRELSTADGPVDKLTAAQNQLKQVQYRLAEGVDATGRAYTANEATTLRTIEQRLKETILLDGLNKGLEDQAEAIKKAEKAGEDYTNKLQGENDDLLAQIDAHGKSKVAIEQERLAKIRNAVATDGMLQIGKEMVKVDEKTVQKQAEKINNMQALNHLASMTKMEDELRTAQEQLALSQEELRTLGMTGLERTKAIALRKVELEYAKRIAEIDKRVDTGDLDPIQAQLEKWEAGQLARVQGEAAVNKAITDDYIKTAESINQSITDALLRGFEGGKDFAKNFRDTLVNMFKTLVLRPVISFLVQPISGILSGALSGIMGGGAASAGQGGIGSMANSALNWATGGAGIFGSAAAYGAAVPGLAVGGQQAAMLAAQTGAFGAEGLAATAAAGGSSLAPLISAAPYLAAAAALLSIFSDDIFGGGIDDVGVMGKFGGAKGFSGQSYQDINGGWFGSDSTDTQDLPDAIARPMAEAWKKITESVHGYAEILGLDASKIADFTHEFKLSLGDSELEGDALNKAVNDKLQEALKSGSNALAQELIGSWTETMERVTRTTLAGPGLGGEGGDGGWTTTYEEDVKRRTYKPSEFAREGEDAITTLTRLATSLSAVNAMFDTLGLTMYEASLKGGDMASQLADAFGGLDKMQAASASYFQNFYTGSEQHATALRQVREQFDELDVAMPRTRAQFRDLVESLDLTTEEGRKMYAGLLAISEAFAAVTPELFQAGQSLSDAITQGLLGTFDGGDLGAYMAQTVSDGINNAVAGYFAQQITDIMLQGVINPMIQAAITGSSVSAAVSQATIDQMIAQATAVAAAAAAVLNDPAFRDALDRIGKAVSGIGGSLQRSTSSVASYTSAVRDSGSAADRAASDVSRLQDAWKSIGDSLMDEVNRIRGVMSESAGQGVDYWQAKFAIAKAQAMAGDQDAAKSLAGISQNLLRAGEGSAGSLLELQRLRAQMAQELQDMARYAYGQGGVLPAQPQQPGGATTGGNMWSGIGVGGMFTVPPFTAPTSTAPAPVAPMSWAPTYSAPSGGASNADVVAELRALRQALEDSNRNDTDLQRRTVRVLERMDTLGMPPARVEA